MASTTTQRRKAAPKSQEGIIQVSNILNTNHNNSSLNNGHQGNGSGATSPSTTIASASTPVQVATVKRNKCGTGPFDENWLK